jgi:hypothetical protein
MVLIQQPLFTLEEYNIASGIFTLANPNQQKHTTTESPGYDQL